MYCFIIFIILYYSYVIVHVFIYFIILFCVYCYYYMYYCFMLNVKLGVIISWNKQSFVSYLFYSNIFIVLFILYYLCIIFLCFYHFLSCKCYKMLNAFQQLMVFIKQNVKLGVINESWGFIYCLIMNVCDCCWLSFRMFSLADLLYVFSSGSSGETSSTRSDCVRETVAH